MKRYTKKRKERKLQKCQKKFSVNSQAGEKKYYKSKITEKMRDFTIFG